MSVACKSASLPPASLHIWILSVVPQSSVSQSVLRVRKSLYSGERCYIIFHKLETFFPLFVLPTGSHLFAQPHLSRYYCDDVHFNNQQSAVENKTSKNSTRYHGCQSLRNQLRGCVKVRVEQRREGFDAPPPIEMTTPMEAGWGCEGKVFRA